MNLFLYFVYQVPDAQKLDTPGLCDNVRGISLRLSTFPWRSYPASLRNAQQTTAL